jgi:hypothetical protein
MGGSWKGPKGLAHLDLVFCDDAIKFNSLIVLIPEGWKLVAGG